MSVEKDENMVAVHILLHEAADRVAVETVLFRKGDAQLSGAKAIRRAVRRM